ncbi:MAG: dihydroneopterin aldolase [Deltaproteobacteria bacterium]|nr:dihydroneopterin aldolase [Deltaproteobacteria bacterium]
MPRYGWIKLQNLHADGVRLGIYPHEKRSRQSIVIDVSLYTNLSRALDSEKIADTVDYDRVAAVARELSRARHYPLIESLAEALATTLLDRFKPRRVVVAVTKPGALAPGSVSVSVERGR